MKRTIITLSMFLFSVTCSANNSDLTSIMKSCLYQKSLSEKIKYTIIKTDEIITDDNYRSLGEATYVNYKGHDIGYAESKSKRVIFYNKNIFPLDHAITVDTGLPIKGGVKDIEYLLSKWAAISIKK
ncbi:hypothetical protein [Serratia oryzae]|uniref:Uncharacterized protein n=1 Tax=Serratia oryzae TaxID=2034155 RepID=A0A1S8CDQ6_9GAMM|nr:hypothetical protein [Serratia oryzae]OMQ18213.1 hypothetical protein BMI79_21975 [Serratia oryzae]VXD08852.1 conserved exported hypothetical protein [Enterobacterales bacterium 8AC]